MHISNFKSTTKKSQKRSVIDTLRKEKKWNHIECSIKTTKAQKRKRKKIEAKNKGNEEKTVISYKEMWYICNGNTSKGEEREKKTEDIFLNLKDKTFAMTNSPKLIDPCSLFSKQLNTEWRLFTPLLASGVCWILRFRYAVCGMTTWNKNSFPLKERNEKNTTY